MNCVELWGYKIYEDGRIVGLNGKKLSLKKQIRIIWGKNKTPRAVSYARFVYYAFNYKNFNFNDKTIVIKHINNNEKDCSINNLKAIKRKFISQGQYNGLAKLTNAQAKEIIDIYNNNKEINLKDNDPTTKISYRKLAEKYGVSHTLIREVVNGTIRNENTYIMK